MFFRTMFKTSCLLVIWLIKIDCSVEIFKENRQLLERGEEQLKSVERLVLSPYGSCWTNAVSNLKSACPRLNEESHMKLAFEFASCFMQKMGFQPINCEDDIASCLQSVKSDVNWFTAYLQYHTNTHNMCYFLNHQLWLEKTESTINKLSDSSKEIGKILEDSTSKQLELINMQSESVNAQKTLLKQGESLNSYLEISHSKITKNFDDFQKATQGQQSMVMDMLNKLSFWMQFLVDHISSFYTMTFYFVIAFSSFLVTSTPRTSRARAYLIFMWIIIYILEFKCRFEHESLWILRYSGLGASFAVLIYCGVIYQDYETINNRILRDVYKVVTTNFITLPGPTQHSILPSQADVARNLVQLFAADAGAAMMKSLNNDSSDSESSDDTFIPGSSSESETSFLSFPSSSSSSRSSTPLPRNGPTLLALEDGVPLRGCSSVPPSSQIQHSYNLRQRRSSSSPVAPSQLLQSESPRKFGRLIKNQSQRSKVNSALQVYLNKKSQDRFSDGD